MDFLKVLRIAVPPSIEFNKINLTIEIKEAVYASVDAQHPMY